MLALVGRERMKWDKTRICKIVLHFQGKEFVAEEGVGIKKHTHWLSIAGEKREGLVNVHHRKH